MAQADPLAPEAILPKAAELSPNTESHLLTSPAAVLTTLIHAVLVSLDFKLRPGSPSSGTQSSETGPSNEQNANQLPESLFERQNWNLKYTHPRSSLTFEMVVSVLGPRLLVNGIAHEDNKTKTLDIVTTDYFSLSSLPVTSTNLNNAFASSNRLKDLLSLFVSSIVRPLAPDLVKGSASVQAEPQVDDTQLQQDRARRGIYREPAAAGGERDRIPGPFPRPEADFPRAGPATGIPPIGRSDLDPLAGLDGTTTGRMPLGGGDGDGMILGPNHPLFRDRFAAGPSRGGMGGIPTGPFGGDGFLPSGAVPPGARFDPIVPGPAGRFGPGGGVFPGGRGPIRRGDPDNDEFMPPRNSDYDSMFM